MSYFPHGAFVAIHAANEQQRRDQEEEEEMTRYTVDELDSDWEFKIVRSETGAFRKPEVFSALLQEEQIAGWELVEKLDNRRVRLKRQRSDRRRDATLPPGIDPYRSNFGGASSARIVILIMIAFLLAAGIGAGVLFSGTATSPIPVIAIMIGGVVMVVMFVAIVAIRRSM